MPDQHLQIIEHKQPASDEMQALKDLPGGLKELAGSIRETPANISRELGLVEKAFYAGGASGGALGLVGGVLVAVIVGKVRRLFAGK